MSGFVEDGEARFKDGLDMEFRDELERLQKQLDGCRTGDEARKAVLEKIEALKKQYDSLRRKARLSNLY